MARAGPLTLLHGDPHDGNWMGDGRAVFIDFESAVAGPVEWDAAYFDDEAAQAAWPTVRPEIVASYRLAVSAKVAVYCWRAVAVRAEDDHMRWHAELHLGLVRTARG